jgi:peptidoglycan/xylan/chitin deacetylase (PgdA/CDA1 family)
MSRNGIRARQCRAPCSRRRPALANADIPNWAWHEYGNRVGFWRFVEVFDALSIPAVLAINGSALAAYPAIVRAALDRDWEFMGHGFTQRNMQKVEDERADIRKTREVIAQATGKPPRVWRSRTAETWERPICSSRRLRLRRRLGARRSAGLAQDQKQADPQPALHAGMQRCRHDAHPASQGVGI